MRTKSGILTAACLVVFIGISLNSSFVLAQDAENNKVVEQTNIEEQAPTRSPGLALGLSLGTTVLFSAIGGGMLAAHSTPVQIAGGVMLGTGFVFGPAVGQAYSDRWGKAALFSLGRAAAGGMVLGGLAMLLSGLCFDNCDNHSDNSVGGIALILVGALSSTAFIVWGIADSYYSAKQYNEEHAKKSISVSPFIMPSSSRNGENGTAVGIALAGRF